MKKVLVISVIIVFIVILLTFYLQKKIVPITDSLVQSQAQYIGNKIINDTIIEVITNEQIDEIFILQKDEAGRIIAEKTNTIAMNLLKSKLHNQLNESFSNIGNSNFYLPLGNIIGFDLLSTYGPKLYVKLFFYGNVAASFENEFYSAGINQTKHICSANVQAEVRAVVSGRLITCQIESSIPIAEVIIVGDIPQVLLNNAIPR